MRHHLKHMALGGGVVLVALLAFRVDVGTALFYALLAACPLGMIGMIGMMDRHSRAGHGVGAGREEPVGAAGGDLSGGSPGPRDVGEPRTRENHERIP